MPYVFQNKEYEKEKTFTQEAKVERLTDSQTQGKLHHSSGPKFRRRWRCEQLVP